MLAAKLLASQLRQTVKPTTCRALVHTEIQSADHAGAGPTKASRRSRKDEVRNDEGQDLTLANIYFKKFPNYCQMINDAKQIARRSVLIDHCGLDYIDLKTEFSNIERVYNIEKETKRGLTKLSLIEFKSEEDAENVAKLAKHNEGLLPVPLKVFRYVGGQALPLDQQKLDFPIDNIKLSFKRESSTYFDKYSQLLSNNMMSLIALKLRFITLVNFERILCAGMFQEYELMPYGSSVIDLGCDSGDLDLVVTRKEDHNLSALKEYKGKSNVYYNPSNSKSKLVHLDKSLYSEAADKSGIKGTMRWFDHILREYMPLTDGYGVLFVRHARVPIIKFTARITNIDCDLSFNLGLDHREREATNSPNTLMAQILYTLCRNNNLFTALSIYLKIFAKLTNIVSKEPNVGMTNFQYLSLIMFYLQQTTITRASHEINIKLPRKQPANNSNSETMEQDSRSKYVPLVPPFKEMLNTKFEPENLVYSSEEIDEILSKLVVGFFDFYSNFEFTSKSMNLNEDRSHNICHNVNRKGLETFVKEIRLATSGIRQGYNYNSPLALIKYLMVKSQQREIKEKKTRQLRSTSDGTHLDLQQSFYRIGSDGVAQDVCR